MSAPTGGPAPHSAWQRFLRGPLAPAAAALVAFAYQLPFFDRWFSFMDEGHILLFADIIARGGEIYRDATVYPLPGAFYLLAAAFELFGTSNLVARWIAVVEFSLFVGLVFVLMRKIVSPGWAAAAAFTMLVYRIWAFPHWHMYSYSTLALLVQLLALLALLRFAETGRRAWLPGAGLLFGLGVFCKQDYGAVALLTFGVVLFAHARTAPPERREPFWKLAAWFLAPAVAVGAATALHFARQGLFRDFLQLTVWNHFVGMSSYDYSEFPSFLPLFEQDPQLRDRYGRAAYVPGILYDVDLRALRQSWFYRDSSFYDTALKLYYYLPYAVCAVGLLRVWRRRAALRSPAGRDGALAELALAVLGSTLIALVTLNRPQDYVHLAVLYWPVLCLVLVALHAWLSRRRVLAWSLAAVMALPVGAAVAYTGRLAWRLRVLNSAPVPSERARIFVEPQAARFFEGVLGWIASNTEPDEAIAVMPYFPILHFYADRPGPHRSSYIVWPFPEFADRDRQVIEALDADQTRVLVYNFNQFAVFERSESYAADLFRYLVDHYELEEIHTSDYWGYALGIALRSDEPSEGRPLLNDGLRGVSVTLRSEARPPEPVPPGERAHWVEEALWPFRHVLAVRPSLERRTVASLPARVPRGARLRTAVGIHPAEWDQHPPVSVTFELAVAAEGRREVLYRRTLRPTPEMADRGWFEVDVSLERWAGREVEIELSTATDHPAGERPWLGGWALPRWVPGDAGAAAPARATSGTGTPPRRRG